MSVTARAAGEHVLQDPAVTVVVGLARWVSMRTTASNWDSPHVPCTVPGLASSKAVTPVMSKVSSPVSLATRRLLLDPLVLGVSARGFLRPGE
jgi:hypothetical protein